MFALIQHLSFAQLSWISILAYLIHFSEEAPRITPWFNRSGSPINLAYTNKKLWAENIILFLITLLTVILVNLYPHNWFLQVNIFAQGIGFFTNALFHGIPTIKENLYSPGVVTACSVFPLVLIVYVDKAWDTGLLNVPFVLTALFIGCFMLPAVVFLTHKVLLKK